MITVNKDNVLHLGGRPFLNPSPPHALIMGHTAGNNWSHGSNSKISFEWTRAGSHAMGMQVCQQPAKFFFFSYSNRGKDRVCFHIRSHTSLFSSMSSLHIWGRVYALLHSKASVPFHCLLYWFVLSTSISRLWLYYDKAGYLQYRNVLFTCN